MEQSATSGQRHAAWNKGKLVGQKSPLKLKDIWASGYDCESRTVFVTLLCSTWPSIPS